MRQEPHRLIFVDECATKTNMTRARGRARRGVRVRDHAPHRHAGTQTFIAGLRHDRLVAPWLLEGAMDRLAFETWVETQLAPGLCKGDVVILDNLAVHKSPKVAELLRARGAWALFLPKYSPDLNPIEQLFSKLKHWLRKAAKRSKDAVCNAIGHILDNVTQAECSNYFKNAGYDQS